MAKKNRAEPDAGGAEGEGPSFEQALERLETIVEELEGGSLSLEQSIARYEEGVKLSRRLTKTLEQAEKRIERLTEAGGELSTEPMDLDEAEAEEPRAPRVSERAPAAERTPAAGRARASQPPPSDELPF